MSFFEQYRDLMQKVYGQEITRVWWDNACKPKPSRRLTDDEFDYDQYSRENGDGPIY